MYFLSIIYILIFSSFWTTSSFVVFVLKLEPTTVRGEDTIVKIVGRVGDGFRETWAVFCYSCFEVFRVSWSSYISWYLFWCIWCRYIRIYYFNMVTVAIIWRTWSGEYYIYFRYSVVSIGRFFCYFSCKIYIGCSFLEIKWRIFCNKPVGIVKLYTTDGDSPITK